MFTADISTIKNILRAKKENAVIVMFPEGRLSCYGHTLPIAEGTAELIKKYALYEGYEVFEAENGQEAINICRINSFDLIVMDIMMPHVDGFTACKEIRKTSSTPIIMLSALGEEYDRIRGFETGVDDYVVKPFSPKELMLRI